MEKIVEQIISYCGMEVPELIVKAPGRINLIGEHTDYNDGFAMPAAINYGIYCAVNKTNSADSYEVHAMDKKEHFMYQLDDSTPFPKNSWKNYVLGVVQEIQKAGKILGGFKLVFSGNIPQGAGLSSSAALENAIAFSLNMLFDLGLTKHEMTKIGQLAEHNFVGVQCGLMDQQASMFGQKNKLLKVDFLENELSTIDFNLADYELVLINSNVTHQLASTEYNVRRKECESALQKIKSRYPNVRSYQDVDSTMYEASKTLFTDKEFKRVQYLDMERVRVLKFEDSLKTKAYNQLGNLLFDAHNGLKNLYEVTCAETDFLVEKAMENQYVIGARQMGGGFGGCTINLIEKDRTNDFYTEELQSEYWNKFNKELSLIPIEIGDGTCIVWKKENNGTIA